VGGTAPYTYAVLAGGAGGTVNPSTGAYVAPPVVASQGAQLYDTVQVTDSLSAQAQARILVGSALLLLCDIIQTGLGLQDGRVYLWDQKIMQPTDSDLYIAVSEMQPRVFGNNNRSVGSPGDMVSMQYATISSKVDIDIISRGPAARDRKGEVIMALNSNYAQQQQYANSFYVGKMPPGAQFLNLSQIDGAAIPYRYKITIALQYTVTKTQSVPYFDTFVNPPTVYTNS